MFVVESIFKTPNTNMSIRRNGDLDSFVWPPSIAKRALSGLAMASMKLKYLAKKEIETLERKPKRRSKKRKAKREKKR